MPDPSHPNPFPSSKPEKQKTVFDRPESINVTYKTPTRFQNFVFAKVMLQDKITSIKNDEEILKPLLSSLNRIETKSVESMSNPSTLKYKKPSIFLRIYCWIRYPEFGFFGSKKKKMSDKQPGRPMKYPYTLTAKIAQFPYKYHINNSWMWKYYFIAVAVSFPLFYKISKLSNTPENKRVWDEIRRKEFTPGGHH